MLGFLSFLFKASLRGSYPLQELLVRHTSCLSLAFPFFGIPFLSFFWGDPHCSPSFLFGKACFWQLPWICLSLKKAVLSAIFPLLQKYVGERFPEHTTILLSLSLLKKEKSVGRWIYFWGRDCRIVPLFESLFKTGIYGAMGSVILSYFHYRERSLRELFGLER